MISSKASDKRSYSSKCQPKRRRTATTLATYTTGILRRPPGTQFALVDAVNLSAFSRSVTVRVYDWSSGTPVALPVFPCETRSCTLWLGANRSDFLYADVSNVQFKYEVRITRLADRNLVTNVFGVSNTPFTPQTGGTVLQKNLVRIRRMR
ncbi:conserved hypothetical protein [Paenibacillus curdlanolyticus YK9]|uniref:Uncharacterized protein n=1 Tax=Paenibacillus curdlanolyticus YK9 TaxID=717606 RepID=E0IG42_9BACL|nr:hypothetical protein [Paenibacillus curdlanolyticus]EFM08622.1 conserved hypothetical protein [Paenibacillus curdlanolyticus YK9]